MRKIIVVCILLIMTISLMALAGCGLNNETVENTVTYNNERFKKISYCNMDASNFITIYYDTETLVMYQLIAGSGGKTVVPLYNSDGSVMLYKQQ